jgi:hypothetical protein
MNWEGGSVSSQGWADESIDDSLFREVLLRQDERDAGLEGPVGLTAAEAKAQFVEGGKRAQKRSVQGAFEAWKKSWLLAIQKLYAKVGKTNLGRSQARNTGYALEPTGSRVVGRLKLGGCRRRVIMPSMQKGGKKKRVVRAFAPRQRLTAKARRADMGGEAVFSNMEKAVFRLIMSFTDTDVNAPGESGWHELPGPARNWPLEFDYAKGG